MSKLPKVRLHLTAFEDRLVPASFGTVAPDSISVSPDDGGVPRVEIVNPATGETTGVIQAFEDSFRGGVRSALGDVNGDGVRDVAIVPGPGGAPRLRVLDGASGATLIDLNVYEPSFRGGLYVALGDVNGDGKADVITGTGDGGAPRVRVLDGATLGQTVLRDYFAYETTFRGGVLVSAGDGDGDRKADVITGTGVGGGPRVVSFAGSDNHVIQNFFADEDTFRGGVLVSAGDVDGDGRDDIITGTGPGGGPVVRVVNASNQTLQQFLADDPSFRGGVAVDASDVNGDGRDDIITGTGPGGGPVVRVIGANNRTLQQFLADDASFRGGVAVDASDVNGDGRKDVITRTRRGGTVSVNAFDNAGGARVRSFTRDVEDATPSNATPATPAAGAPASPTGESSKNTSLVASKVEGAVTAIDAAGATVTVKPQAGAAVVVKLGPTTKVERNGKHAKLTALKVGDAAEAKLGGDGVALTVEATGA